MTPSRVGSGLVPRPLARRRWLPATGLRCPSVQKGCPAAHRAAARSTRFDPLVATKGRCRVVLSEVRGRIFASLAERAVSGAGGKRARVSHARQKNLRGDSGAAAPTGQAQRVTSIRSRCDHARLFHNILVKHLKAEMYVEFENVGCGCSTWRRPSCRSMSAWSEAFAGGEER